mgnify:CR=1 FL=1
MPGTMRKMAVYLGLVEDDDRRRLEQEPGDREALPLAGR